MNKKWVFPPVSFFERKEVCPCQVQAMERRESLWSLLKLTQQSEAFESVQRTQSVASTDLFFSVHTEGALVHERKSWSGLCFGHWKPFQVHGLLWSPSCNEFLAVYNIISIIVRFWRLGIKTACFYCFDVIFLGIVYPLTTTEHKTTVMNSCT